MNASERSAVIVELMPLALYQAQGYLRCGLEDADCRQEAFVGIIEGVDRFDPSRGVKQSSYAASYARWSILDALHENRRREMPLNRTANFDISASRVEDTHYGDPVEAACEKEDQQRLEEAICRLPDHMKQVIRLRLAGLTQRQTGNRLGVSRNCVGDTEAKAIRKLRFLLGAAQSAAPAA